MARKFYMLTDADFEQLAKDLELQSLRDNNVISKDEVELDRFENSSLFRSFNYVVRGWISEMKK